MVPEIIDQDDYPLTTSLVNKRYHAGNISSQGFFTLILNKNGSHKPELSCFPFSTSTELIQSRRWIEKTTAAGERYTCVTDFSYAEIKAIYRQENEMNLFCWRCEYYKTR